MVKKSVLWAILLCLHLHAGMLYPHASEPDRFNVDQGRLNQVLKPHGLSCESLKITEDEFKKGWICWQKRFRIPDRFLHDSSVKSEFFVSECVMSWLELQTWPKNKLVPFDILKPFLSLLELITAPEKQRHWKWQDCAAFERGYGSHVFTVFPGRHAFLYDRLSVVGDVVSLGTGYSPYILDFLSCDTTKRLILNDINLAALLLTAAQVKARPEDEQKKLFFYWGRAEDLSFAPQSVQKYYAGYLFKYLTEQQCDVLSKAIADALLPGGRFYYEELNENNHFYQATGLEYRSLNKIRSFFPPHIGCVRHKNFASLFGFGSTVHVLILEQSDQEVQAIQNTFFEGLKDEFRLHRVMTLISVGYLLVCIFGLMFVA